MHRFVTVRRQVIPTTYYLMYFVQGVLIVYPFKILCAVPKTTGLLVSALIITSLNDRLSLLRNIVNIVTESKQELSVCQGLLCLVT
jgi:hypothetical protein